MFGLNLDALLPIGLLVGWIVVMRFILPRLGISTWMSSSCRVASPREEEEQVTDKWRGLSGQDSIPQGYCLLFSGKLCSLVV